MNASDFEQIADCWSAEQQPASHKGGYGMIDRDDFQSLVLTSMALIMLLIGVQSLALAKILEELARKPRVLAVYPGGRCMADDGTENASPAA